MMLLVSLLIATLAHRRIGRNRRTTSFTDVRPREPPKVGFSQKKMPKRVDAVVIGSGPGGLACASMLAKRGKACLILEANEALGGGLHSWEDKGVPFDTGFHYLGEVHCGKCPLRCLLDYLAGGRLYTRERTHNL